MRTRREIPTPDAAGPDAARFLRESGRRLKITCARCGDPAITIESSGEGPVYSGGVEWTCQGPIATRELRDAAVDQAAPAVAAADLKALCRALAGPAPRMRGSSSQGDPDCERCGAVYCGACWCVEMTGEWGGMDVGCGGKEFRAACPCGHAFDFQGGGWSYG